MAAAVTEYKDNSYSSVWYVNDIPSIELKHCYGKQYIQVVLLWELKENIKVMWERLQAKSFT